MRFKALIGRVGRKLISLSKSEDQKEDPKADRYKKWFGDNGDKTHRLNYQLGPESTVIDLGGYEGQWTSDIYAKYRCKVFVFEPAERYYNHILSRFHANSDIKVYKFGLGAADAEVQLFLQSDRSTLFNERQDGECEVVQLKAAAPFLNEHFENIDLIKINIEGGEYDLLSHLIETGWIERIKNIQVQFHDFVPNAESRMDEIQKKLAITHKTTYQYPFVWENWKRVQ